MQLRLRSAFVALCLAFATPTLAQSQAERLAQMMSRNYAMQSLQALMLGDGDPALALALKAFPPDPSEEEVAALPEALFALEVATGARIAQIDAEGTGLYSVDRSGTRAFVGFFDPRPDVNQQYAAPAIHDPRDGTLIKVLDPIRGSSSPEKSPEFSPDGSLLAYPSHPDTTVQLFQSDDGTFVGELQSGAEPAPQANILHPLGFSDDGQYYALGYIHGRGGIYIWNVTDRTLADHLQSDNDGGTYWMPLGWDHEGGFAVQKVVTDPASGQVVDTSLERWQRDGSRRTVADLDGVVDEPSLRSFTFPGVPLVLMTDEARLVAVDLETGETRFTTEVSIPEVALVRDGTAFSIRPFDLETLEDFQILESDGDRLQPRGRDLIPLAQAVVSRSGMLVGLPKQATRHTYQGHDLPEGVALYAHVWRGLSDGERRLIDQDRVMRP